MHSADGQVLGGATLAKADQTRRAISHELDSDTRARLGQFLTPASVAMSMANMFESLPNAVRLLDPGAGIGTLTAAFVRRACTGFHRPTSIDVTAFEIDSSMAERLDETLASCATECESAGVHFSGRVIREDFITHAAMPLISRHSDHAQYDCVIMNPPYAKIRSNSGTRSALRSLGIETTNLYSAFVAVALDQLKDGGQLVAITPRSFCNGPYFESFRRALIRRTSLIRAHTYESRRKAFADDNVLQENVLYHLVKGVPQRSTVLISASHGPSDPDVVERAVPFSEVVLPADPHQFIRLTHSTGDGELAGRARALPCRLGDLGLQVSTGRVVDFRARPFLRDGPGVDTVPLIYPCHFERGGVTWPRPESRKPNAIVLNAATATLMVPGGIYVLTKRFSSKEERRRLVAVVFDPQDVQADWIGFENHLNYFHCGGGGMPMDIARGLSVYLNSTAVDRYFRQFSGHTQVNATDLRNLHYPAIAQLEAMGRELGRRAPTQQEVDEIVGGLL